MKRKEIERFWSKVDKSSGCWVWKGSVFSNGYGAFYFDGQNRKANRISWLVHTGEWPGEKLVCHKCDNPLCVRPSHLWTGTPAENSEDMVRKGRAAVGERNGKYTKPNRTPTGKRNGSHTRPDRRPRGSRVGTSKLTETQVESIRALLKEGIAVTNVAKMFGVSRQQIYRIRVGRAWNF